MLSMISFSVRRSLSASRELLIIGSNSLPNNFLRRFKDVTDTLYNQFASRKKFQKNSNHLLMVKMKSGESLKKYVSYFQSQMALVYNCNEEPFDLQHICVVTVRIWTVMLGTPYPSRMPRLLEMWWLIDRRNLREDTHLKPCQPVEICTQLKDKDKCNGYRPRVHLSINPLLFLSLRVPESP